MKPSVRTIVFETLIGRMFLVLWIGGFFLIGARLVFEARTLLYGSTIIRYGKNCDCLIHIPPGRKETRYPLLIYLHGAGERNRSLRNLSKVDLVAYAGPVAKTRHFPFLVVSPKTDRPRWEPDRVVGLLDELLADETLRWQIDPARIYLTGFSMGGFGVFATAAEYPDRFAAVVPVAGGGDPATAERFERLPVWAFHGAEDETVPCELSVRMLEEIRTLYPDTAYLHRMTVFADDDHSIGGRTYRKAELYRWLLYYRNITNHESSKRTLGK